MKLYAFVWSPTGGTARVAAALTSAWEGAVETVDLFLRPETASEIRFDPSDVCLAAIPSYGGRVPASAVSALKRAAGNGARAIPVVVYGNRAYEDTLIELCDVLREAGFCSVAAVIAVAEHSIFRRYAAGRPDAEDVSELQAYMRRIAQTLRDGTAKELLTVPGERPYKFYAGSSSFKPIAGENCTLCGLCAEQCPADAIPAEDPKVTDPERCISCMHCIAVCPAAARNNQEPLLSETAEKLYERFAGRKTNELLLG